MSGAREREHQKGQNFHAPPPSTALDYRHLMDTATVIGSLGVALLLIAFLLNVLKLMSADGYAYTALNFVGAALACYSSWLIAFMPFVVLEGVWALVAAFALGRKLVRGAFALRP
jgi:hypothetical protein